MSLNSETLSSALSKWNIMLSEYHLPKWEELLEINLYMDQVIILMNQYLSIFYEASPDDKLITPSIINNYVKLGIIPCPNKKKYAKEHLAYLIMVCTLKQSLSIATIKKIIPVDLDTKMLQIMYNTFVKNQAGVFEYITNQVTQIVTPYISSPTLQDEQVKDFALQAALSANTFKILTEKIATMFETPEMEVKKQKAKSKT